MRPGAGQRHIKVIASRFCLEAPGAAWPGSAICGDPVAELRRFAHKMPTFFFGIIPLVDPFSLLQQSHLISLL